LAAGWDLRRVFFVLPTRITLHGDGWLTLHLREAQPARTVSREVILDVNDAGRWIRGIELLGGAEFDLARAVGPLNPRKRLSEESNGVTYDEEANAAFLYFSMRSRPPDAPETALKYSRSISANAELAFDSAGGLVWLRFSPRHTTGSLADFVSLIDAPLERFTAR